MAGYIGTIPVPQATQTRETFTATANQTSFATGGYTPNFIDVFMNGVKLAPADFTATNGSDVVLASGAAANDIIDIVAFTAFQVLNQNFTGNTSTQDLTVSGNLTVTGSTITIDTATVQNVDLGDNDKIRLGDGDDLQIYHDGSHSYIDDQGTGRIYIRASDQLRLQASDGENYALFAANGAAQFYYDNSLKLATTASGVDVTGTAVTDGLTVDGNVNFTSTDITDQFIIENTNADSGSAPDMVLYRNSASPADGDVIGRIDYRGKDDGAVDRDYITLYSKIADASTGSAGGSFHIQTRTGATTGDRFVVGGNGNIGIGTSSPSRQVSIVDSTNPFLQLALSSDNAANNGLEIVMDANGAYFQNRENTPTIFSTNNSERMRIDSSGNVHITDNTNGPDAALHIEKTTPQLRLQLNGNSGYNTIESGGSNELIIGRSGTEQMRIDSSGNLLVGTTSLNPQSSSSNSGVQISDGFLGIGRAAEVAIFNRQSTDGDIILFRKNGSTMGQIGTYGGTTYIGSLNGGIMFNGTDIEPTSGASGRVNNTIDLGSANYRYKDLYLSSGIYLGGTTSANKLDDYEEGTWTPNISTGYSSATYNIQHGTYTKIGDTVRAYFRLDLSGGTALGVSVKIGGLPFTVKSDGDEYPTGFGYINDSSNYANNFFGIALQNTNTVGIYYRVTTTSHTLHGTALGNSLGILYTVIYRTAA